MTFIALEGAAKFPRTDISEQDASQLELLLMNQDIVEETHQLAESSSFLYQTGHCAIRQDGHEALDDHQAAAVSYGAALYEATAALVRPDLDPSIHNVNVNNVVVTAHHRLLERFVEEMSDANDAFLASMQRTAEVIRLGGSRRFATHTSHVIAGAALARQIEMWATDPQLLLQ